MFTGKQNNFAYIYLIPALIIFGLFVLYPILFNVYFSFWEWDGITKPTGFVGLRNYLSLFKDDSFRIILRNTLLFGVGSSLLQFGFGLLTAALIMRLGKVGNPFQTLMFLPAVLTPVVVGFIFQNLFETNFGLLNRFFRLVGLVFLDVPWLAQPHTALIAIILTQVWQWTGFFTIVYLAGMSSIPKEIYESAAIDGASWIRSFFSITMPLLRGSHFSLLILQTVSILKIFDIPWVLTKGGPAGRTEFFSTLILKKSFILNDQASSSAIAVILLILALAITAVQLRMYRRRD
jgi:raffinose/stachyose/melibiose transport system permease protein